MPEQKAVILDGAGLGDGDLAPVLNVLSHVLEGDGARVETFPIFPRRARTPWRWPYAASSPLKAASRGLAVLPWAGEA
jgi:hypothetical protein